MYKLIKICAIHNFQYSRDSCGTITSDNMNRIASIPCNSSQYSTITTLYFGTQQFQDIHKLIQPMVEYQSILGDLRLTFTNTPITDIIDLNDDAKAVDELSKFESNIDLLPGEEEVIDTIIKDEAYLNWFNKCANKIHDVEKETVAKWIFFYLLDRIFTKLFDFMLDKII